jgi:hypothetical protein
LEDYKAKPIQPVGNAGEVAPIGYLYDWTHSSALGRGDESFTSFAKDIESAERSVGSFNIRPVFDHPPAPADEVGGEVVTTCEVAVAPATVFGPGVRLSTVVRCIISRDEGPHTFNRKLSQMVAQPSQEDARDAARWKELCRRVDNASEPSRRVLHAILDDAIEMGAGALELEFDGSIKRLGAAMADSGVKA